jgi:hypothetical protein
MDAAPQAAIPVPQASRVPGVLLAEHRFIRDLLGGAREAAEQVLSGDASEGPVLFALLHEVQTVLGRHLIQETALLWLLLKEAEPELQEILRSGHARQWQSLSAIARWFARGMEPAAMARNALRLADELLDSLDAEERDLLARLGASAAG